MASFKKGVFIGSFVPLLVTQVHTDGTEKVHTVPDTRKLLFFSYHNIRLSVSV